MTEMHKLNFLSMAGIALLTALFFTSATPAYAQQGPDYLHALSDLRMARGWIKGYYKPEFRDDEKRAVDQINLAIDSIRKAVADDGRNANFQPPPQGAANPAAPFHTVHNLLTEAYNDCARGVDYPQSVGLQNRALQSIRDAQASVMNIVHGIEQGR
jgi:hypothetical protein